MKLNLPKILSALAISISLFGADKTNTINQTTSQNFLDILQTMSGEYSGGTGGAINIPVLPSKTTPATTAPAQQTQPQDKTCTRIIVDNKTVIYHCGEKTFLKRFGTDGGLFLVLTDGKKVKLTD